MVPFNNLDDWNNSIIKFVDLDRLEIQYVFQHSSRVDPNHGMTPAIRDLLRTSKVALPAKGKLMEAGVYHGVPKKGSSTVWVLSTWQSWTAYYKVNYGK